MGVCASSSMSCSFAPQKSLISKAGGCAEFAFELEAGNTLGAVFMATMIRFDTGTDLTHTQSVDIVIEQ